MVRITAERRRARQHAARLGTARLLTGACALLAAAGASADSTPPLPQPGAQPALPPLGGWNATFGLKETVESESNPKLLQTDAKSTWGVITTPSVDLSQTGESQRFDFSNRVVSNEYSLAGINSTDLHSALEEIYKAQTWNIDLKGLLDYDTTLTSEVTTTGVNLGTVRHTSLQAAPEMTFNLTDRTALQLTTSFQRAIYGPSAVYTSYDFWAVSPTLTYAVTPQDTASAIVQYSQFGTAGIEGITIQNGMVMAGWTHKFSDLFNFSVSAGGQRSYWNFGPDSPLPDTTSNSYAFNASINYTGQQDALTLTAGRNPSPNGLGTETISTQINLDLNHAVTQRLDADLKATYARNDYPAGTTAVLAANQYLSAAPKVLYHLTDTVSVDIAYQFRMSRTIGNFNTIDNDVMFDITVQLLPRLLGN